MTTHVYIFDYPQALQECVEWLIQWGRRDTELAYRVNYRPFVSGSDAPFIDSKIQVSELSPGVVEVSFFDGRLPEETRYSAIGLAMYAKVEGLPGDRVEIGLSCAIDEFIPHWERLLGCYGQVVTAEKENAPPEEKTRKKKGGRKPLQAHRDALQRLLDGQSKEQNRYQWKEEYQRETGVDPEHTESGADELYRSGVWRKYRRKKPDG